MSLSRSASQILFGYLPEQTVDVNGLIWKVKSWTDAKLEGDIDYVSLKREICRLIKPWDETGRDGGLYKELLQGRANFRVKRLNNERGVYLTAFPKIWVCKNKNCQKLHTSLDAKCDCGTTNKAAFPFVAYCEDCGNIRNPGVKKCSKHDSGVKVKFPGTTSSSEIVFQCTTCNAQQKGFHKMYCQCGSQMKHNIHRAAVVYTPRSVVIVNPPSREKMNQLKNVGGRDKALSWVINGMIGASVLESKADAASLRSQLQAQGLSSQMIETIIKAAIDAGELSSDQTTSINFNGTLKEEVEFQAVTIAMAMLESRQTIDDMIKNTQLLSHDNVLYNEQYKISLKKAGLETVELLDKFPVLTGHFGYTRGNPQPGQSRLRAFEDVRNNDYVVYGDIAETEALFVRLSPEYVARWLVDKGYPIGNWSNAKSARAAILSACNQNPTEEIAQELTMLVHSFAHRFIRLTAVHAGIERNALSELLTPLHLSFFVYAAAKGDFVLGGLQAVFESGLHTLLNEFVEGEHRCALDPGCSHGKGACIACLHLGETSCRHFNNHLDRAVLTGSDGYLRLVKELNAS